MILLVNIKQLGSRKKVAPVQFEYSRLPETLRELIVSTVEICVDEYNKRVLAGENAARPLSAQEIRDRADVGKIAFGINNGGKTQELAQAVENAVKSFSDGLYRVFLGENELTELDDKITLNENDTLTFIRLTMLSGRMW